VRSTGRSTDNPNGQNWPLAGRPGGQL